MPNLTEVERLFTSESSGRKVKSSEKRKYHVEPDSTLTSTRMKSRKAKDPAIVLLSVSSIARYEISKNRKEEDGGNETPKECTLNFVNIPEEFDIADEDLFVEEKNEVNNGNHIVDIKKLDKTVRENFCYRQY